MKKRFTKAEIINTVKNTSLVVLGTLVLAFGTSLFMLPYDLVAGGLSGYSIVLSRLIPSEILTVEQIITIMTWAMFIIGAVFLGKAFALKTLVSTIVYPIGISLFSGIADEAFLGGFFNLGTGGTGYILASVFSGVMVGLGCALSFLGGGSTGGVDSIAFTICKYFKKLRSSIVIFVIDAVSVLLGMIVIGDFALSLLGIVSAFVAAIVIDKVFLGGNKAFVAHIITSNPDEITEQIIKKLERTTTVVDVVGGYSGESKKMLIVSFSMKEYSIIMAIITAADKNAFMTVNRAHEINGEGWTR